MDILQTFANNAALMDAVRNVIETHFSLSNINLEMPNEEIGQVVRANIMGRTIVDNAFKEIISHKSPPVAVEKTNPAR